MKTALNTPPYDDLLEAASVHSVNALYEFKELRSRAGAVPMLVDALKEVERVIGNGNEIDRTLICAEILIAIAQATPLLVDSEK